MSDYSLPYIASYGLPRVASAIRALAEQQRIANLIALLKPDDPRDFDTWSEIASALGLGEEQDA